MKTDVSLSSQHILSLITESENYVSSEMSTQRIRYSLIDKGLQISEELFHVLKMNVRGSLLIEVIDITDMNEALT